MPGPRWKPRVALLALAAAFAPVRASMPEAPRAALADLDDRARAAALLDRANTLESQRPLDALALVKEGLPLAVRLGDKAKEAAFLSTEAFCCSQIGELDQAVADCRKALALGVEIGDRERVARAHNTLGITYTYMGNYSQALAESIEALRIRQDLGQEKAIAQSLNLIGVVYHHSGQYGKAIEYFEQILNRAGSQADPRRIILAKHNLGFALYKLGRLNEALENHLEAVALARKTGETASLPYAHLNLGLTYTGLKRFDLARENLRLALAEYRQQDQRHGLIQVLRATARLHLLAGTYAQGIPLAKEGADLARRIKARDELKECDELLSQLYGKLGNLAESFRYYRLADEVKDTLYSAAESDKIAEASMQLVTLKKDHEIEALKREQVIASLSLEKHRYITMLSLSGTCFLVTGLLVLGYFNKKMRQNRASLEQSNAGLARMNGELQERMKEIRTLSGLLPICGHCKKIRDDAGYWTQLEGYISQRTTATFSHGICPHCAETHFPDAMDALRGREATPASEAEG